MGLRDDPVLARKLKSRVKTPTVKKVTVTKGQSWNQIANQVGVTTQALVKANPNVYKVSAGQTINVPKPPRATAPVSAMGVAGAPNVRAPSRPPGIVPRGVTTADVQAAAGALIDRTSLFFQNVGQGIQAGLQGMAQTRGTGIDYSKGPVYNLRQVAQNARVGFFGYGPALYRGLNPAAGWRDVGAGGRYGVPGTAGRPIVYPSTGTPYQPWLRTPTRGYRDVGAGGREWVGTAKPYFPSVTLADYAIVPDYPSYGGEMAGGYGGYGGYGGGGGGGGGGGEYDYPDYTRLPSTSGPEWNYSPGGYQYGNFNYGTLGLVNWRI